jgi:PKD domain
MPGRFLVATVLSLAFAGVAMLVPARVVSADCYPSNYCVNFAPSSQDLYYNPSGCIYEMTAQFTGSVSGSAAVPPYTYLWTFGDGTSETRQTSASSVSTSHIYPIVAKTYDVTLVVTDSHNPPHRSDAFGTVTVHKVSYC